jgi:two-component system NtrC family sensor kinase
MNSIDACTEEDSIEIKTFFDNNYVVVECTDTGSGISEEDIPKVFDLFYTTKEIGKGTGLGLSVCYNIIKQHGGEISFLSSKRGGTIVTVTFPVISDDS